MALISAKTILTSLCLFHITLGFFFLTNPGSVADQAVVYLLGETMGLVRPVSVTFRLSYLPLPTPLAHPPLLPCPQPARS